MRKRAAAREVIMTVQESPSTNPISSSFTSNSNDMAKRIDAAIHVQREMIDTWERVAHNWFAHVKSETRLASELTTKLAAARSLPERTSAYQSWLNERMQLIADDGRRMFADGEELLQSGLRLFGNGHDKSNK
jgi:hypothetical protein